MSERWHGGTELSGCGSLHTKVHRQIPAAISEQLVGGSEENDAPVERGAPCDLLVLLHPEDGMTSAKPFPLLNS